MVGRFFGQLRVGQETKYAYTIICRNEDYPFLGQCFSIINWHAGATTAKAAAVYPQKHGFFFAVVRLGPHVEVQAIFADRFFGDQEFRRINHKRFRCGLHWAWSVSVTFPHTSPKTSVLGGFPS